MPAGSGQISATGNANAVACSLIDGSNNVCIRLLLSGGTYSAVAFNVEYSQDGSTWNAVANGLITNVGTGSTGAINSTTGGDWTVELPGPGFMRIWASTLTIGMGAPTMGVSIFVGSDQAGAVGQNVSINAQPSAPTLGYYLVNYGSSVTLSGIAADFLGNIKPVDVLVPTAPIGSVGTTNFLQGLLNTALGQGQWMWVVFYNIAAVIRKYTGSSATGAYSDARALLYPVGSTLDVGPVPDEYLGAGPATNLEGQLLVGVADASGVQANVQAVAAGFVGPNALATGPAHSSVSFDIAPGSTQMVFEYPEGTWAFVAIDLTSFPSVSNYTAFLEGSNDSGFNGIVNLPLQVADASGPVALGNPIAKQANFVGSTLGYKYIRLRVPAFLGIANFTGSMHATSAPISPSVTTVVEASVQVADHTATSANVEKSTSGSFLGAIVDTAVTGTLFFQIWDGVAGSGTLKASMAFSGGASGQVIKPPYGVFCLTEVTWRISSSRNGGAIGTLGTNATIFYV